MLQSSKLLSVFKPDTLSGVLTLFNDHNLSYSQTGPEDAVQIITLMRVYQLKYLGYLKLIGSGYNWCHWSPIRWDPCGALNLDVQDVYANGCTVNGTVQVKPGDRVTLQHCGKGIHLKSPVTETFSSHRPHKTEPSSTPKGERGCQCWISHFRAKTITGLGGGGVQ